MRGLSHSLKFNARISSRAKEMPARMDDVSTFDKLTQVLRGIFDGEELVATPGLSARAVNEWDSLGHARLFVEIERVFGVRFNATGISSLKNVGQLADLLERKVARNEP